MTARSARVAALIVPSFAVALITGFTGDGMAHVAGEILLGMWVTTIGALLCLALDARRHPTSLVARIDVLTSTGAAMLSTGAIALLLAAIIGWASLAVLGMLGVGTVYLAVIWNAVVAYGDGPWRRATITRAIVPERAVEGEALREEISVSDVRIAPGMRLFISGRAMKHGPMSRYVIDASGSGAELRLESELGPALRGEHHAPPLELWLCDVLGITRSAVVRRAELSFTVAPRLMVVTGVGRLLSSGGEAPTSAPTQTMPTEGSFRIREYVDGDDTRRIHWIRSMQQNRLVVRLPDEIPPADPIVRLVLDNELANTDQLTCRAPAEMLDALVRVWLGIGKALAEAGTRVSLLAAVPNGDAIAPVERVLVARSSRAAVTQLGARVTWQASVPLASLVADRSSRQIVVSSRPRHLKRALPLGWVVVPETAWTAQELELPRDPVLTMSYPIGCAENRTTRKTAVGVDAHARWHDRAVFSQLICWTDWVRFSGDHVACPDRDRARLEVIP